MSFTKHIKRILLKIIYYRATFSLGIKGLPKFLDRSLSDKNAKEFWDHNEEHRLNISVIMKVKNGESYALLALESVAKFVKEIIVIDNGSSDKTPELLKSFQHKYNNKIVIKIFQDKRVTARAGPGYLEKVKESPKSSIASFNNEIYKLATQEYLMKMDAHYLLIPSAIPLIRQKLMQKPKYLSLYIMDILGRQQGFEALIFRKDSSWRFEDRSWYEQIIIPGKKEKLFLSTIFKPAILHLRRLV